MWLCVCMNTETFTVAVVAAVMRSFTSPVMIILCFCTHFIHVKYISFCGIYLIFVRIIVAIIIITIHHTSLPPLPPPIIIIIINIIFV